MVSNLTKAHQHPERLEFKRHLPVQPAADPRRDQGLAHAFLLDGQRLGHAGAGSDGRREHPSARLRDEGRLQRLLDEEFEDAGLALLADALKRVEKRARRSGTLRFVTEARRRCGYSGDAFRAPRAAGTSEAMSGIGIIVMGGETNTEWLG